jgi:hypothetical protein
LEECNIEVDKGSKETFTLKESNNEYILSAQDDTDRKNWIIEILKTRDLSQIISLTKDKELGKYALMAIVNVANTTSNFFFFLEVF